MAYGDFTLTELSKRFGLTVQERGPLYTDIPQVSTPTLLKAILDRWLPLATQLNIEKAKSELLIAPILVELKLHHEGRLSVFSGIEFNIDLAAGLVGRCDFILAHGLLQMELAAPVCMIVEAKREDIVAGVPQCLAAMVAAQRFNNNDTEPIYGIVTTGLLWRFLELRGKQATVDIVDYPIQQLDRIYSILTHIAVG